ncbi:MAG: hypothetical protein M3524_10160 [Actinomycetota bacterium]|nr:hypothetical protein [Actinomycetota bacterium]
MPVAVVARPSVKTVGAFWAPGERRLGTEQLRVAGQPRGQRHGVDGGDIGVRAEQQPSGKRVATWRDH